MVDLSENLRDKLITYIQTKEDFEIHVGNEIMKANKIVLKLQSKYFNEYFASDKDEDDKKKIILPDKNADTIQQLIHATHDYEVEVNDREIIPLAVEAIYFGVDSLEKYCHEIFNEQFKIDNINHYYEQIRSLGLQDKYYHQKCTETYGNYLISNSMFIKKSKFIINIEHFDDFCDVMNHVRNGKKKTGEITLFRAIDKWIGLQKKIRNINRNTINL